MLILPGGAGAAIAASRLPKVIDFCAFLCFSLFGMRRATMAITSSKCEDDGDFLTLFHQSPFCVCPTELRRDAMARGNILQFPWYEAHSISVKRRQNVLASFHSLGGWIPNRLERSWCENFCDESSFLAATRETHDPTWIYNEISSFLDLIRLSFVLFSFSLLLLLERD